MSSLPPLIPRLVLPREQLRASPSSCWRSTTIRLRSATLPVSLGRARTQIAQLGLKHRLPTSFAFREYVEAGGLISYGVNFLDMWRRAAEYADKVLKGAKPSDLPVERPTKFELVINVKTAKTIGLTIPQSLLGRA